jgi:ubiquitin carboxyl-terminal hydrolase L5
MTLLITKGECGEDWMPVARTNIHQRIAQYDEDGLQFNLLSLCKSPLRTIPEKLAQSMHSISAVEKSLTATLPDWKQFLEIDETVALPIEANDSFALSTELITTSSVSDSVQRKLKAAATDPSTLLDLRRRLVAEQSQLQRSYVEEIALIEQENEQAARRKVDYTLIIYSSIKLLADQGVLKEIVRDLRDNGGKEQ